MKNGIVVPKQEKEVRFDLDNWENVGKFRWLCLTFNLEQFLEIEPLSTKFVVYDEHAGKYLGPGSVNDYERLKSKLMRGLVSDVEYIVLPEAARLIVKHDVTIEQFFDAMIEDGWFPAAEHWARSRLEALFENVAGPTSFKEELLARLESPPALDTEKRTTVSVIGEQPGQELELELLVTKLFGWDFIRLLSIKYNDSKFEHLLLEPANKNVYQANSKHVGLLSKDYFAAFTRSDISHATDKLIKGFLQAPIERIIINEDMVLRLKARRLAKHNGQPVFSAYFEVFEPDYTIFLE
jgi:hypothetical protein